MLFSYNFRVNGRSRHLSTSHNTMHKRPRARASTPFWNAFEKNRDELQVLRAKHDRREAERRLVRRLGGTRSAMWGAWVAATHGLLGATRWTIAPNEMAHVQPTPSSRGRDDVASFDPTPWNAHGDFVGVCARSARTRIDA